MNCKQLGARAGLLWAAMTVSQATAASWPGYQNDAAHTGYVPTTLDVSTFQLAWRKGFAGSYSSELTQAAAADGTVYFSRSGYFGSQALYAVSAADGSTLWTVPFSNVFSVNPPAYDSGRVYIQTVNNGGDSWLRAYDASTGGPIFQAAQGAQWENYLAPTIVNQTVYVDGGTYGGMYSFNGTSGTQNWFTNLPQYDGWTPAVDDSHAYAFMGSRLYVLDRDTGTIAFSIPDNSSDWYGWTTGQAPVLGGQNDVLVTNGGRLVSFDLGSRVVRWTQTDGFNSQPSVAKGVIYTVRNGYLSALSETDGQQLWMWAPSNDTLAGTVVVTDSHVFVSGSSTTYAIDLASHQSAWSTASAGRLSLADGQLYIASQDGTLTAITVGGSSTPSSANLKLSLTGKRSGTGAAQPYAFNATVSNKGPAAAANVTITVKIPLPLAVKTLGAGCRYAQQQISCTYGSLSSGKSLTASFTLLPSRAGLYVIGAKTSSSQPDPVAINNYAQLPMLMR